MGRASIGASLLSGAEWLKKKYKLNNKIKAVSEWETLHRFYCILLQSKIRKERSDFAAVEFWCRGAAQFLLCRNATSRLWTFRIQYHLYFFRTMFGAKIYNIVCFFSFVTNPSLAASMSGCRGRQPLHICVYSLSAAKSLRSLRILLCIWI